MCLPISVSASTYLSATRNRMCLSAKLDVVVVCSVFYTWCLPILIIFDLVYTLSNSEIRLSSRSGLIASNKYCSFLSVYVHLEDSSLKINSPSWCTDFLGLRLVKISFFVREWMWMLLPKSIYYYVFIAFVLSSLIHY